MAMYTEALMKNPMVIYPSLSGEVLLPADLPLILLAGATNNLFIEKTWHHTMLGYLQHFGYNGKVYIPSRLEADDIDDYQRAYVAQEQISNKKALMQSHLIIYWGTDHAYLDDVAELLSLAWNCSAVKSSGSRVPQYLFGAEEGSARYSDLQGLAQYVRIYSQMSQVANDAVEIIKTNSR